MKIRSILQQSALLSTFIFLGTQAGAQTKPLKISGVYPHLATFNEAWPKTEKEKKKGGQGYENGIGAITPWAGKLCMVTYSPQEPHGSADKLYSIDKNLEVTIHPESIGGTPANRMIHRESNQLITSN